MDERMAQENIALLSQVFSEFKPVYFKFRFWNGKEWDPPGLKEAKVTVVINNPGIMAHVLAFPTGLRMGEAYIHGDIDIEGNIYAVFPIEGYLKTTYRRLASNPFFWKRTITLKKTVHEFEKLQGRGKAQLMGKLHTIERDRQAISYHYDLPPEFYALYLGPMMNYSCAYFRDGKEDLATAQKNKLELVCRKLRLKPRERVLDIGCGWGGFAVYAAKRCQAKVVGITLSEKQAQYAQDWIKREGLQDLAEVRLQDYREVQEKEGYDKLVSIGMFEHVGGPMLKTYFQKAIELLKPCGVFLNHGIAADWGPIHFRKWSFTEQYVFPDGQLIPISKTLSIAEKVGFEVRDVESLREHYAFTLRHWAKGLEKNKDKALRLVDQVTYRVWHLHMAGSSYGFATNQQSIYQALLVKPDGEGRHSMPITREDIYRDW
jgi:cyclopropane-fatty-acyl-phospholipid synthase